MQSTFHQAGRLRHRHCVLSFGVVYPCSGRGVVVPGCVDGLSLAKHSAQAR